MDRYAAMFERLAGVNQGAFVPFVTIGDPNPEASFEIICTLVEAGADALELGIPFSDPLADGPTIQGATIRALENGTTSAVCFDIIKRVRARYPQTPIGLLMYANLVYARGADDFFNRCVAAGVDSVLIADVPVEESAPFHSAAQAAGIHSIYIAPPNADEETLSNVARLGGGYTYLLSRAGVTGAETKAGKPIGPVLAQLAALNAAPPLLGFGISEPAQVREAIDAGAAGAIAGSAVVKVIERNKDDQAALLKEMHSYIQAMKAATVKS